MRMILCATHTDEKTMKLTIKQENFCNYYIETGNASEAYRRSYDCSKMSERTIPIKAYELLDHPKIKARIKEIQDRLKKKSDISKERILEELRCIAFANIRDFVEIKEGQVTFKDSKDWTDEMSRAVESVKNTKDGIEIKLNGKGWSISRICKMMGYDEPTKIDIKNMLLDIDTGVDG